MDLQHALAAKGAAKGLRGGWHKLAFEGCRMPFASPCPSDGKTALSGHEDKTVKAWELETGKLLKIMEGRRTRGSMLLLA